MQLAEAERPYTEQEQKVINEYNLQATEHGPAWFVCPFCDKGRTRHAEPRKRTVCGTCEGRAVVHLNIMVCIYSNSEDW